MYVCTLGKFLLYTQTAVSWPTTATRLTQAHQQGPEGATYARHAEERRQIGRGISGEGFRPPRHPKHVCWHSKIRSHTKILENLCSLHTAVPRSLVCVCTSLDASTQHHFLVRLEQLDLLQGLEVGAQRVRRRRRGRWRWARGGGVDATGAAAAGVGRLLFLSVRRGANSLLLLVALPPKPFGRRRVRHGRRCCRRRRCARLLCWLRVLLLRLRPLRPAGHGRLVSICC